MRSLVSAALAALLVAAPLPAFAQTSLSAYDAVHSALVAVWDELPLSVRNVTLVREAPRGFGQYERRVGNSFAADEPVTVYAELYGYGVTLPANGGYMRELSADLALLDSTGAVRANQIGFWSETEKFESRPLEMSLGFSATLSAFSPGDYTLRFTVHDGSSDETVSFDVPITIAEGDAPAQ
jgi:hypothetical protein